MTSDSRTISSTIRSRVFPSPGDRGPLAILFFFTFLYAYFYQGGGWAQNSEFDSIRAIVERGKIDITDFSSNTGDVGQYHGRIYSNKPPGLAFAGAPFYWVAYHAERVAGADPNSVVVATFNAHLLTFILSGVPGVVLLLILFRNFRRRQASAYEAFFLTGAFGMGSLLLPYSGVMMNHLFTACLLFGAWHILSATELAPRYATGAGILSGMAVLTDSLSIPAVALFVLYLAARRRSEAAAFLAGVVPFALLLLEFDYLNFGSPFASSHSIEADSFKSTGGLMGVLDWPQPVRLLWLTIHPFRGLFYCCPVFIVSLFSLRWPPRMRELTWEQVVPLLIVGYHFLFNMSFNGWTGGWGIGPRYLIPALPFLYSFALAGYRRFLAFSGVLAMISAVFMVSATAVRVIAPAPNFGPPPASIPIFDSIRQLLSGQVSVALDGILDFAPEDMAHGRWASYNLGELAGLHGLWSLTPVALAFLIFCAFAYRLKHRTAPDPGPCEMPS